MPQKYQGHDMMFTSKDTKLTTDKVVVKKAANGYIVYVEGTFYICPNIEDVWFQLCELFGIEPDEE
jgi:hypothetical protein